MKTEAIVKINTEMQKNPNDKYTEIIGQYLIDRCTDETIAARIMDKDKSLKGAMDAVLDAAKKKKQGNVAVLMPGEVFGTVDKYFKLPTDEVAQQNAIAAACGASVAPAAPKEEKKLSLSLEAFL